MPEPIEGVLFDFHSTLADQGDPTAWLRHAWRHAGRDGSAEPLGDAQVIEFARWTHELWDRARVIDPDARRDLDPTTHRDVFDVLAREAPGVDATLARSLYDTMLDVWTPYADALPVLRSLRDRGIRTALVSNVGLDVHPLLDRSGLAELLDGVVLSYEVGVVKPEPGIFAEALERISVAPERALMVGDSWRDDGGAAQLGIRTLILPRTAGPTHGLDAVLHLLGP